MRSPSPPQPDSIPHAYAELHCKSNFTFLEGASHPEELVSQAIKLGYRALALTDRNSLAGIVRAYGAARDHRFQLVVGSEITPLDTLPLVLWPTDRAAYGHLARLITLGRRRAEKGSCILRFDDLADHAEGLLAGILPVPDPNAPSALSTPHNVRLCQRYAELFSDRAYLLASLHAGPDDQQRFTQLSDLSKQTRLPLIASGNVHYHIPDRKPLHDTLTAIRHGTTVSDAGSRLHPNASYHLRTGSELAVSFQQLPDALRRTTEVVARCDFCLSELRYEYPEELTPDGMRPFDYLQQLTWQGAQWRYPQGVPSRIQTLITHELTLIDSLRYEAYFLTVWDLVQFARRRRILCQGRGSAANSVVCYCLGITSVDPDGIDVLFERFVSHERDEAPDIDVDFEHERREEVLQYLYQKYGRERAGIAAEVVTYRCRSAVRDVGRALGLSADRVDALAKQVEHYDHDPDFAQRCLQVGIDPASQTGRQLIHLVDELIGFPRHLSQHVGGMVITQGPLCEMVPIENAAMEGRTVIQWNKDDLEELGILKVDCLALGMLTAIHRCFDLVQKSTGNTYSLATVPQEDPQVYDMICKADTMGVFQIESRAQMSMLPRLQPRCYYDLVIEVAIVRPGPIQGQMVHPYLRRRSGDEEPTYPNDAIRDVLHKTLGVPLFQEQAMRLAVVAAGFTPGEADQLRRAMGAWRRPGLIDQFHKKLLHGMRVRGLSRHFAEQVFQQIRGFGEYGFPESHAASFALLVYVSAWLKHHYPAAFTAALLNSQPMGFYAPAQLIRDAREHQVLVRPIDVNHSDWDCTLEPISETSSDRWALRLGLRLLHGVSRPSLQAIFECRKQHGPFSSHADLVRRTNLSRAIMTRLARADALKSLSNHRRQAIWDALAHRPEKMPLFDHIAPASEAFVQLEPLDQQSEVMADYQTVGLSLRNHPLHFHRETLNALHVLPNAAMQELPDGKIITVAGIVLLRQRPATAKGITFVTLEDETGIANLVIPPQIWKRYYSVMRRSPAWIVQGKLQKRDEIIHLLVSHVRDLPGAVQRHNLQSRDFR